MSPVRIVIRGKRRYYYLVRTYRSGRQVLRKDRYLGTVLPRDLGRRQDALEREIWEATWFPVFQSIHDSYQTHQRKIPSSILEKEREQFVVEFTYETNRIEGSTLTFQETNALLTRGSSPRSRPMRDIREAQLHAELLRRLLERPEPLDLAHLLSWHQSIFGETKPDIAGRIRDYEVRIGGSRYIPPSGLEVRPMLLELLRWVRRHGPVLNPVERAALFHFRFENIHPFGDGNGRIGRLATNLMLQQEGFPMLNIRYARRAGYYHALEKASLAEHPHPFLLWFFHRYVRDQQRWRQVPRRIGPSPG